MIAAGCTIDDVIEQGTARDVQAWLPQGFGRRHPRDIEEPIIEPLWIGLRVLVRVDGDRIDIVDEVGDPVAEETDRIVDQIHDLVRAESLVLDGYLTHQATNQPEPKSIGYAHAPSIGQFATQMFLGRRPRSREIAEDARAIALAEGADSPLAFVAVDLLLIDDTALLDVPLLERKRILASALDEGPLVRVSAYVRPPVGVWASTWRALGFVSLAYKSMNSRYEPGVQNDGWAIARIPKY